MSDEGPGQGPPGGVGQEAVRRLAEVVTGYRASQVVGAVARFRIADRLANGPLTIDQLAVRLDIPHDPLYRLLRAAATVGVIEEVAPRTFALAPLGHPLRSEVTGSLRSWAVAATSPGHWLPWGRLPHAVVSRRAQTGATLGCGIFEYYRQQPDEGRLFAQAMSGLTELVAAEVARRYDFSGLRLAVDVGGSQGALLAGVLEASPHLRGIVYDLPEVVDAAREYLSTRQLSPRCEVVAGDFFRSVPPGGDVYLLKHVLHDWPDDEASVILRQCREMLGAAGRVLVVETVLPPDGERARSHLSDLNMLVVTGGRERTLDDHSALFRSARLRLEDMIPLDVEPGAAILVAAPA